MTALRYGILRASRAHTAGSKKVRGPVTYRDVRAEPLPLRGTTPPMTVLVCVQ
jgi:hypothetical protein